VLTTRRLEPQKACDLSPDGRARNCDVETVEYELYSVQHPIAPTGSTIFTDAVAMGGYDVRLQFAASTTRANTSLVAFSGRSPGDGDDFRAVYFLSLQVSAPHPVTFEAGTIMDIWFPRILDTEAVYTLTLSTREGALGRVTGTLHDNALRFVLPKFVEKDGETLEGTVSTLK
jgi:hypothetical protein